METKTCAYCKVEKEIKEFSKAKNGCKKGLRGRCKLCISTLSKTPREIAVRRKYQQRPDIVAKRKAYEKSEERQKQKRSYYKTPDVLAKRQAQRRDINKQTLRNNAHIERVQTDEVYRFINRVRTSMSTGLKNNGFTKRSKTYELLQCSYDFFMNYLGAELTEGMQLDHIIPISLAQTEKEAILLSHYSNFQVLTAEENMSKSNRYIKHENLLKVLELHPQANDLEQLVLNRDIEIIY